MRRYQIEIQNKQYTIDVEDVDANNFRVVLDNQTYEVNLSAAEDLAEAEITPAIVPAGQRQVASITTESKASEPAPRIATHASAQVPVSRANLTAPMPGTILELQVKVGDKVKRGQTIAILEAMKMKNAIKSPQDGVISQVVAEPGKPVRHGDVLVCFEETE
jgi:biotin carboxyl carrier protein